MSRNILFIDPSGYQQDRAAAIKYNQESMDAFFAALPQLVTQEMVLNWNWTDKSHVRGASDWFPRKISHKTFEALMFKEDDRDGSKILALKDSKRYIFFPYGKPLDLSKTADKFVDLWMEREGVLQREKAEADFNKAIQLAVETAPWPVLQTTFSGKPLMIIEHKTHQNELTISYGLKNKSRDYYSAYSRYLMRFTAYRNKKEERSSYMEFSTSNLHNNLPKFSATARTAEQFHLLTETYGEMMMLVMEAEQLLPEFLRVAAEVFKKNQAPFSHD